MLLDTSFHCPAIDCTQVWMLLPICKPLTCFSTLGLRRAPGPWLMRESPWGYRLKHAFTEDKASDRLLNEKLESTNKVYPMSPHSALVF